MASTLLSSQTPGDGSHPICTPFHALPSDVHLKTPIYLPLVKRKKIVTTLTYGQYLKWSKEKTLESDSLGPNPRVTI